MFNLSEYFRNERGRKKYVQLNLKENVKKRQRKLNKCISLIVETLICDLSSVLSKNKQI